MNFLNDLCKLAQKKIILASQSPRRIELLRSLGVIFEQYPSEEEKPPASFRDPQDYVCQTALSKLDWVWERTDAHLVIAADTIVVQDHHILGKPGSPSEARAFLYQLSDTTHQVITAICLRSQYQEIIDHEMTRVTFYPLSEQEIEHYIASEEPFDKAGGYGIQGIGSIFVKKITGCYFNVVGFPSGKFYQHLKKIRL